MEEFYKKDIDELLDDSNWDLDSQMSDSINYSLADSDKKVRGLESIYLQRLHAGIGNKPKKQKARFRHLQKQTLEGIESFKESLEKEQLDKKKRVGKQPSKTAKDMYFPEDISKEF